MGAEAEYQRQMLEAPGDASTPIWRRCGFVDVNSDGLSDLLVLGVAEKKLWIYRQRATGFVSVADQTIPLPPQTGWIGVCDVAPAAGTELVFSTSEGLSYLCQTGGVFEVEARTLIQGAQPFTNASPQLVGQLIAGRETTNGTLPLLSKVQAVSYRRTDDFQWLPQKAQPLQVRETFWQAESGDWNLGSRPSRALRINQSFRPGRVVRADTNVENASIKALLQQLDKEHALYRIEQVDLNGDGRQDFVIRRQTPALDPRTDLSIFLCGTDDRLPERPTQILRCSGFPVQAGSNQQISAFCDLNGDGVKELLLVSMRTVFLSSSGLMEMALSRGFDMVLNIREYHPNGYALKPDASVELTVMPLPGPLEGLFLVEGDFNGDRRLDLLVRRSFSEWNVFLSSSRGGWFQEKPGLKFEIPFEGDFLIKNLNDDNLSDLVVESWEDSRICIFLSRSKQAKH